MNLMTAQTARALLPSERLLALRACLVENGRIRVDEATALLGVSGETVRRYLRQLAAEGTASLVRGGAILAEGADPRAPAIPPVDERTRLAEAEKEAIGSRAADLVNDGNALILDGGTTTLAVARHLRKRRNLTIMTNNLMVAQLAAKFPGCRVYVIGGKLLPESMSLVGLEAIKELAQASVDWAFLGAAGVSVSNGFTSADPFEAELKRGMISIARRVAVVADHTKMAASGFATFASPAEVNLFITSKQADPASLRAFAEAGVEVITA